MISFMKKYDSSVEDFMVIKNPMQSRYSHLTVFYHKHDWEGEFKKNDHGYRGTKEEYDHDFSEMVSELIYFFERNQIDKVIIGKYDDIDLFEDTEDNDEVVCEINHILDIRNERCLLEALIKSNFDYFTHYILYNNECDIVVEPTHNFEFLIFYNNSDLIRNSKNLNVFVKNYY